MTKVKDSKLDFLRPDIYTGIIKPIGYTTTELNSLSDKVDGWIAEDSTIGATVRWNGTGTQKTNNSVF